MTLLDEARLAEQIGDAFTKFRAPNPEHAQDINAAISELNNLGWSLREVDKILNEDDSQLERVETDLKLVHTCITITLGDIWAILGDIGDRRPIIYEEDFQQTWKEITRYCRNIGKVNLNIRLDSYRRFVLALCQILKRQSPGRREFNDLLSDVQALSVSQGRGLLKDREEGPSNAVVTQSKAPIKQPSYERHRDGLASPVSPVDSNDSRNKFAIPWQAGSPPMSPSTTVSSASQVSNNSREVTEHWAKRVFADTSITPLLLSNEQSEYHDVPDHPNQGLPSSKYDEAIALSFPPDLRVSLHCRSSKDLRCKMVVEWPVSHKGTAFVCLPMEALEITRSGCMLRFCRPLADGVHRIPWVSLQFSTIERLILFACTFISMRSHSGKRPYDPIWYDQEHSEVEEYSARIVDNRYRHTLCIYRDKPSRSIRLQAAMRGGPLDGTPIWTAWITHQVTSPTWCDPLRNKVVLLRDLRLHIFSSRYEPERAANGAYVLIFESSSDTKRFVSTLDELGKRARRGRLGN